MCKSDNQQVNQQTNLKCLYFVDRMRHGGIQTFLIEIMKHMNHSVIETDFLLLDDGNRYPLETELEKYGTVYKLKGIWVKHTGDFIRYRRAVDQFFSEHHKYDVVHINSGPKNYYMLKAAEYYHVPIRVAHSHNGGYQTESSWKQWVGELLKHALIRYANVYLACSDLAGEWMFGKKLMTQGKVHIIPNGVNLDRFRFDPIVRREKRKELQVDNRLVIGNVGRFTTQKNHSFLIDVFMEISVKRPDALLVLAGTGDLQDEIEDKVKQCGLENKVKFLGYRSDVTELMQAMDIFLMPSLFEGFPVTAVEAQACGLPCVFSDTITAKAKLLENTIYVSLEESPQHWAEKILAMSLNMEGRSKCNQALRDQGYDIGDITGKLLQIYQNQKNGD